MSELLKVKGIGKSSIEKLHENGIFSLADLVHYFPYKYAINEIETLQHISTEKNYVLSCSLEEKGKLYYIRRKLTKLILKVSSNHFFFDVHIFNREYLNQSLIPGEELVIEGRFQNNKTFIASNITKRKNYIEGVIPEYRLKDLSSKLFAKWVMYALNEGFVPIKENIPSYLRDRNELIDAETFMHKVHHPLVLSDTLSVSKRIKYEELLSFFTNLEVRKAKRIISKSTIKHYDITKVKFLISSLPFELTADQKQATNEIFIDFKKESQMNRLLQGDTGSGKTICSLIASFAVVSSNEQVALMAPTEILAYQHYQTFKKYLTPFGVNVAFLSSSVKGVSRREIVEDLRIGRIDILVGTHSLIQDEIKFRKLGFVVIDEQHRFGVNQRRKMREKGWTPDVLIMSATPIPRTLALTYFSDTEISSIHTMPSGRKEIQTKIVTFEELTETFDLMKRELSKNHQIYVVTPLIDQSDKLSSMSVKEAYDLVSGHLPNNIKIGMLHGKMKSIDKENLLSEFKQGNVQVLVSTTVIEVGVDVKNATAMIIFNAARFGLSQLHQLRGRVGRNDQDAYCYLVIDGSLEETTRLDILTRSNDGFEISEEDLKFRGPGELLGFAQTGIPEFKMANLILDQDLIQSVRMDAMDLVKRGDNESLKYKSEVLKKIDTYHLD